MDKAKHDAWANAEAYEKYVGRWSRVTGKAFLNWLAIETAKNPEVIQL